MFPESCKYLPRALISVDSISDQKDVSCLSVHVYFLCSERVFPAGEPLGGLEA